MADVRFVLDPNGPPPAEPQPADRLTDAEITAAALADPDNPPLTEMELARIGAARTVRRTR